MPTTVPPRAGTAAVLAGAGARGAFEAGVLAGLLPALGPDQPTFWLGTSAGAINAVLFASLAHLGPEAAGRAALTRWSGLRVGDVIASPLRSLPEAALGFLRGTARLGGAPASLFDTAPLSRTLASGSTFDDLHANVDAGRVAAVAVVTCSAPGGETVIWCECAPGVGLPADDPGRGIRYVATRLGPEHVRASAAIPIAFPPVRLPGAAGDAWFVDGGTRLNVPLKPAVDFRAERLLVVSTDVLSRPLSPQGGRPTTTSGPDGEPGHPPAGRGGAADAGAGAPEPTVFDVTDLILHALTGDRALEDLRTLSRINALPSPAPYDVIPFLAAVPPDAGALGRIAERVLAGRSPGELARLVGPQLLALLLGGATRVRGDLISYLLFDAAFTTPAAQAGAEVARGLRAAPGGLWRTTLAPAVR